MCGDSLTSGELSPAKTSLEAQVNVSSARSWWNVLVTMAMLCHLHTWPELAQINTDGTWGTEQIGEWPTVRPAS